MEFTKERISTSLLTEDNYVSTENMLQDFQGVTCSHNVPKNTNVMEYKRGDVLVSNIRPYLKKVWMADKDGGCSADVQLLKQLDIPDLKFHGLRHSFATRCIESQCDYKTVSVILGHANISTTLNLYVHPNMEQKKKCINQMFKALK